MRNESHESQWDYKLILKFEDVGSLNGYMADHHETIMSEFTPKIKELLQQGEVYLTRILCPRARPKPPCPTTGAKTLGAGGMHPPPDEEKPKHCQCQGQGTRKLTSSLKTETTQSRH